MGIPRKYGNSELSIDNVHIINISGKLYSVAYYSVFSRQLESTFFLCNEKGNSMKHNEVVKANSVKRATGTNKIVNVDHCCNNLSLIHI